MINCVTGLAGIVSAAVVLALLSPVLLVLLLLAELPGAWAAIRSARIRYMTNFALADSGRRKWILTDLMADRRTAAELRSFTMRGFLMSRAARLAAYERAAQLRAARQQAVTQVLASAAGGVATAGVYVALGLLLAAGAMPLAVAGTAVLAIRSAQSSLSTLLYSVNQCYEEGLYFSDYVTFCAEAARRVPPPGDQPVPRPFRRIVADQVTFRYPGCAEPALREVSIEIAAGEVVALVGENGSGKTTLAKVRGRAVPAGVRAAALGRRAGRRDRRRPAAGPDRGDRAGPRQLAADRAAQHHHGPPAGGGPAQPRRPRRPAPTR